MSGVIPISNWQLALSTILLVFTGVLAASLRLGIVKSLAVSAVRTFVQLYIMGFILSVLFAQKNLFLTAAVIVIMTAVATQAATRRAKGVPQYPRALAFLALLLSTLITGLMVVTLIIRAEPWHSPRIVIPIFGMILGNSMNAVAISLERLYASVRNKIDELEVLIACGATPWETVRDCVAEAVRAGMTPTINSMMVIGLVSLPGMMTGQILGGADPREAVRYQIVIMYVIAAAVTIGSFILVGLAYKRLFDKEGALLLSLKFNAKQ